MKNILKFNSFINEATLKGNPAFPGEDPEKSSRAFLNAIVGANKEEAERYVRENAPDLNIMANVAKARRIQAGHERELEELAEEAIRKVYGTFIDDVILDLKITNRPQEEMREKMEPGQPEKKVELEDQEIIDEINKRKVIRTIQQGKGLNIKEIINLPMVADRIKEILGEAPGREYIDLLNRISAAAHYFDMTLTPDQKASMFRQAPPGACDIEVKKLGPEEEKEEKPDPEKILQELQDEGEINPDASEYIDDVQSTIIAKAMEFGLLIHESVKGIYKLITQQLLLELSDRLGLEAAEIVISNTETLFDEIEEQAIGKRLQKILGLVINSNKNVQEKIMDIMSGDPDESQNDVASFLEQLHWLVYGKLSQITPARKCLELFHSILDQTIDPRTNQLKPSNQIGTGMNRSMIDSIIDECLSDMEKEKEYQDWKSKYGGQNPSPEDKGNSGPMWGFDWGGGINLN